MRITILFLFFFISFYLSSQTKKENLIGEYVRFENDTNNKKERITINADGTYQYMKQSSYDLYYGNSGKWDLVNDTLKLIDGQTLANDFGMDTISFKSFIERYKQKYLIYKEKLYPLFNNATPYIKKK